jgi:hypothetical protein
MIHSLESRFVLMIIQYYFIFKDWKQDLWSKRFVRDHLRYVDEIICAAARVVEAVREHARKNNQHNASQNEGIYDSMHVRRGDFQYPPTQLPAEKLFNLSEGELTKGECMISRSMHRLNC